MDIVNIRRVMERIDFPEEAAEKLAALAGGVSGDGMEYAEWEEVKRGYLAGELPVNDALGRIREISGRIGEPNEYAAHMLFFLDCADVLELRYRERGIAEEIFWDTLGDMRCKLYECMEVKGCFGTFVAGWYDGFFKLERFALGRLQFERTVAPKELDGYSEAGITIREGDTVINMHIPSSGPLTLEKRLDSYRRAYEFFREERRGGRLAFICNSWLLYPPYKAVFGDGSNITDFMQDFTRIFQNDSERFSDAWRVFGADAEKKPEELPRNTRLRRALAEWMKSGGTAGHGLGIFVYPDSLERRSKD